MHFSQKILTVWIASLQVNKKACLVHRGEFLEKVVKDSGMSITSLVKKLHISRATYYNHIDNKDLPLDIIDRYGKALGFDFSVKFPEIKNIHTFINKGPLTVEEAINEMNHWKERYYEVLEKYNLLMEQHLSKK